MYKEPRPGELFVDAKDTEDSVLPRQLRKVETDEVDFFSAKWQWRFTTEAKGQRAAGANAQ